MGYHAVLAQIYAAYEQRLPKSAKEELRRRGYVSPGEWKEMNGFEEQNKSSVNAP